METQETADSAAANPCYLVLFGLPVLVASPLSILGLWAVQLWGPSPPGSVRVGPLSRLGSQDVLFIG